MKNKWNNKAKQILKTELVKRGISHEQLVEYLDNIGIAETKASIDSKMSRGTFSTYFFLQVLHAIGCENIKLEQDFNRVSEPETVYGSKENFYIDTKKNIKYIDIIDNIFSNNGLKNTVVSLFTGAGGLDIGLENAGFRTIVCIENDIDCRETIRYNRPEWKLFESGEKIENNKIKLREPGDIREIEIDEILNFTGQKVGEIGLVVGGAPCQPFSNIGKREGAQDKKNGDLFLEFVRMVKGIKPKAFIFENVSGITQKKHNDVIKYMIDSFSGSGYGISYTVLNSANYGVPQRRERFFLIGINNYVNPAFPLPTHIKDRKAWEVFIKDLNRKPNINPQKWKTVKEAFETIPTNFKDRDDYNVMNISPKVVNRMTYIEQGQNFKVLPMELRPNCWKNGKHQGHDTFGRLVAEQPSITIRTAAYNPAKGMYIHPYENRGLNTLEMAALQDFPVDWTFKCKNRKAVTLVSAGKQIGNAVPIGLGTALGLAIRKQLTT